MNNKLLFIIIIFAIGCSGEQDLNNFEVARFEIEVEVELDSINIPPVLLHERKIIINSKYLVSMNIESDTIFRVFDLPNFNYVGNFGNHGNGPLEYNHANISGFRSYKEGCVVTDLSRINIIKFPIGQITSKNIKVEKQFSIPGKLITLNHATVVNDTMICGINLKDSEKELVYFNPKSNETGSIIDYSNIIDNVPSKALPLLYLKYIDISYKQNKFAFAYQKFPFIKICNTNGTILKEIIVQEGPSQKKIEFNRGTIKNSTELYTYYNRLAVTDNYIYALFSPGELKQKNEGGHEYIKVPVEKKQLHIFDWNGNPKLKIILEDWMNEYVPAKDDSCIYFTNPLRKNKIYYYSLAHLNIW